jgi:hypothetical protein
VVFLEIATSVTGDDRFLTVDWSGQVSLWRAASRGPLASFPTTWSVGGRRLVLGGDASEPVAVTAAWERHGVCAYDAMTGALLWQRKDVKRVQHLAAPRGLRAVTACSDDGPMRVLDLLNGDTLARVRGVRSCYAAGPGVPLVGDVLNGLVFVDTSTWKVLDRCRMSGFAKIAGAVSTTEALISAVNDEAGTAYSAVHCTTLTGLNLWRWDCPPEVVCTSLSRDVASGSWLGVLHHINGVTEDLLVRWSPSGEMTAVAEVGSAQEAAFVPDAALLLLSDGRVLNTASGTSIAVFG